MRPLLLVAALACSPLVPGTIAGPLDTPGVYALWWLETERCLGIEGTYTRVEWFQVLDQGRGAFRCRGGNDDLCAGVWTPPHTIYVAATQMWSERVIKHEMIHDLTQSGAHGSAFRRCDPPSESRADRVD